MSANRLLTAAEAAALLRLSVWTVYAWARSGRLPCVRLGARVLFERQELEAAIGRARQPPAASPAPAGDLGGGEFLPSGKDGIAASVGSPAGQARAVPARSRSR